MTVPAGLLEEMHASGFLSVQETAAAWRKDTSTVCNLARAGRIPVQQVRGMWFVKKGTPYPAPLKFGPAPGTWRPYVVHEPVIPEINPAAFILWTAPPQVRSSYGWFGANV